MRAVALVGRFLCRALKQRTALFFRRSFYRSTRRARLGYCAPVLARQRVPPCSARVAPLRSRSVFRARGVTLLPLHTLRGSLLRSLRLRAFGRSAAAVIRLAPLYTSRPRPTQATPLRCFSRFSSKKGAVLRRAGRAFCKALPAPFFFKSQTPKPPPLGA